MRVGGYLTRTDMIRRDYLIVGAGAAGIAAAEAIRSLDKKGSIMMIGAEPHPGVRRPDLLRGMLGPKAVPVEKLLMRDEAWFRRMKVDLRLNTVVEQFSLEQRAAVLRTGQAVKFGKALLATGSRARRPESSAIHQVISGAHARRKNSVDGTCGTPIVAPSLIQSG